MSQHQHQMFPDDFLQHLVRPFNNVVKKEVLQSRINHLDIKFERKPHSDKSVVISLFTKLVEAFKSISDKYIEHQDLHTRVRINIQDTDSHFIISISGIIFIPPGKILNLFGLILWYVIRYHTGDKPANSDFGRNLTTAWKKEEDYLRFNINQLPRKSTVTRDAMRCYICGEPAFRINEWSFDPGSRGRSIDMETRVCQKHLRSLI